VLFFTSVGMLFDPRFIVQEPWLVLAALAIVMIGKPLAALVIVALIGYPARTGLTGYSVRGGRRFHVYGRKLIIGVQPFDGRALVGTLDGATLIDARTGRRLHRLGRLPVAVLAGPAAPIF
jgi:CPA2 family monovalent cation:H+ antiporter-2